MNSDKLLLAVTIGNRDLLLDNQEMKPPRSAGENALEIARKEPHRFRIPMLIPVLETLGEPVERLFLFVTDQSQDSAEEKYREKDTLFFGQIIKELLTNHYMKLGFSGKPAENIEVVTVRENPTILSSLLKELENVVLKKFVSWREKGFRKLALCINGGIPALNFAVLFFALRAFKTDLILYRVNESIVFPDPVAAEFEKNDLRNTVLRMSKDWNFKHIQLCIEESGIAEEPFLQIKYLCQAMSSRLVFDFAGALQVLTRSYAAAGRFRPVYELFINDLTSLKNMETAENFPRELLIKELFLNLIYKYRQHEYVDVAGRLFRLLEDYSLNLLELVIGKSLPFSENANAYPEFKAYVESMPDLKDYLLKQNIDPARLNLMTAEKTLVFFKDRADDGKSRILKGFLEVYSRLGAIKQLRNKSIIAHGFKSIRKEDFPEDFIDLINKLASLKGIENFARPIEMLVQKINESIS